MQLKATPLPQPSSQCIPCIKLGLTTPCLPTMRVRDHELKVPFMPSFKPCILAQSLTCSTRAPDVRVHVNVCEACRNSCSTRGSAATTKGMWVHKHVHACVCMRLCALLFCAWAVPGGMSTRTSLNSCFTRGSAAAMRPMMSCLKAEPTRPQHTSTWTLLVMSVVLHQHARAQRRCTGAVGARRVHGLLQVNLGFSEGTLDLIAQGPASHRCCPCGSSPDAVLDDSLDDRDPRC